jgi:hypothetical protein
MGRTQIPASLTSKSRCLQRGRMARPAPPLWPLAGLTPMELWSSQSPLGMVCILPHFSPVDAWSLVRLPCLRLVHCAWGRKPAGDRFWTGSAHLTVYAFGTVGSDTLVTLYPDAPHPFPESNDHLLGFVTTDRRVYRRGKCEHADTAFSLCGTLLDPRSSLCSLWLGLLALFSSGIASQCAPSLGLLVALWSRFACCLACCCAVLCCALLVCVRR